MKNIIIIALFLCLGPLFLSAQICCKFTHYSSSDGLSENTIRCILQDHNGMMWFSTWNGLNSFDGYSFKSYNNNQFNYVSMLNDRIEEMQEDTYGNLWLIDFNGQIHRFNINQKRFFNITLPPYKNIITSLAVLPNGHIWLITSRNGIIRLTTSDNWKTYSIKSFPVSNIIIPGEERKEIFQDKWKDEWLLSNKSLFLIRNDKLHALFKKHSFYSHYEYQNDIWFGSDHGTIYIYNKKKNYFHSIHINPNAKITYIAPLAHNEVILSTDNDIFYIYNYIKKKTVSYLLHNKIYNTYVDREKGVWFDLHENGVARYNPLTQKTKYFKVKVETNYSSGANSKFGIQEDVNGFLWVQPYGGGFSFYNWTNDKLSPFYNKPGSTDCLFSNDAHIFMSDRQGNLWMCTQYGGLEKISFIKNPFAIIQPNKLNYISIYNNIRSIYEDKAHYLWIGTRGGRINLYSPTKKFLGFIDSSGNITSGNKHDINISAYNILQDSNGIFWFCTRGQGLIEAIPSALYKSFKLIRYVYSKNNKYSLSCNNVYDIKEDKSGNLWLVTFDGGLNIILKRHIGKNIFINSNNILKGYPNNHNKVRCIFKDSNNTMWIGTTTGLLRCDSKFSSPRNIKFYTYLNIPNHANSLSCNDIFNICALNKEELLVATIKGLNKLRILPDKKIKITQYSTKNGLPSNAIMALIKDLYGNVWISTENDICKYTPSSNSFENYDLKSCYKNLLFNEATRAMLSNGDICFGTNNGILQFSPQKIHKNVDYQNLIFTQLSINNKEIIPSEKSSDKSGINGVTQLVFNHNQKNFTIQFAAMNYKNPTDVKYAYRLLGLSNEWIYIGNQHQVTYNSLSKGDYIFQVKSTNSDGVWINNTRSINIKMLPAWWNTYWAYAIYIIIIFCIIAISSYIMFIFYRLRNEVYIEKNLSRFKLNFFKNISHELRTPVSMIAAPIENIINNYHVNDGLLQQLKIIQKNTDSVISLINQTIDYKNAQDISKLKIEQINIIPFINNMIENFQSDVNLTLNDQNQSVYLWIDKRVFEKIILNLFSIASGYNTPKKENQLSVSDDGHNVIFYLGDNKCDHNNIKVVNCMFKKYIKKRNIYRITNSEINIFSIKELIKPFKAKIYIDSFLNTLNCLTISFPKGIRHFDDNIEFILSDDLVMSSSGNGIKDVLLDTDLIDENATTVSKYKKMLVIEDHTELRLILKEIFSKDYHVITASNGTEGIILAKKYIPDIIISDIMMPGQDGIEVSREIHKDINTSHIPFILLTAKTSTEIKIKGLDSGADDYITKPFSIKYLKARIEILLKQREKLQEWYKGQLDELKINEGQVYGTNPNDAEFMNHLMDFMKKNLSNCNLHIDDLAKELCMSRSTLFKKIKDLIGLSPVEYVIELRLKYAIKLIEQNKYNIPAISTAVGIDNPKYFSRIFKKKYGMTPIEYKKKLEHASE
jgi:DNA-binding response OmpR family regulator/ligand-binding sensor domain-containing protein